MNTAENNKFKTIFNYATIFLKKLIPKNILRMQYKLFLN